MENIGFVGIAQINPIAGNLKYNAEKIAYYIKKAQKSNLDLVVFPELSLMGYPIEDTIIRYPFLVEEKMVEFTHKVQKICVGRIFWY